MGRTTVTAAAVREWGRKRGMRVAARGRLTANLVTSYNKAHKNKYITA